MGPSKPTSMMLTKELAAVRLDDWAQACGDALAAGDRLVTLFGRAADDVSRGESGGASWGELIVTAVLQAADSGLYVLRGRSARGAAYPSITARHPSAQAFERELWEQTGLVPEGHPWLKPVRYEGARQQRMGEHPFFTMRGRDVHEVGVGPIHAGVIEPGHFRFMCHGERVAHLEIQLGYQHRGVEAMLLRRPPLALSTTIETVAGDTSIAYAWGYCAAVEALAGVQVRPEAELVRGVALELERIAMHLVALGGMATDIAFLQGGATYGRLRTAIINATQRVCGNRFGRGWLRPGGVRHTLDQARRSDLLATLVAFSKDFAEVNTLMLSSRSVGSRLHGTGTVTAATAAQLGLVGLAARASGLPVDARQDLPGRLYCEHPIETLTEGSGDCWARMCLRMREIDASLYWLQQVLGAAGIDLSGMAQADLGPLYPGTLCVTLREGFRGPVVQALETGADGRLLHYKLQDPSLQNWLGLAMAVRENEISDFPICNKSFDLSYCGNDL
jgi:Ni,Fe-hydrogenase III large subunit